MTAEYDLTTGVRTALLGAETIREVKMFGGIGFVLNGNMFAAASKRGLLVRVGKEGQHYALARPGVRPMVMRGHAIEGYVYVRSSGTERPLRGGVATTCARLRAIPPAKGSRRQGGDNQGKTEMMRFLPRVSRLSRCYRGRAFQAGPTVP